MHVTRHSCLFQSKQIHLCLASVRRTVYCTNGWCDLLNYTFTETSNKALPLSAKAGADYTGCTSCFPSLLFLPSHWSRHSSQKRGALFGEAATPSATVLPSPSLLIFFPVFPSRGVLIFRYRSTFPSLYDDTISPAPKRASCLQTW